MNDTPYFPPLYGDVDCGKCEIAAGCWCCGKHQRNRRDFTHTSGRCPRLPDERGFVEKREQELYAQTFPIVHAELGGEDTLFLTLTVPGIRRSRKVYQTKGGYWYFREKDETGVYVYARRALDLESFNSSAQIIRHMELLHADYCRFRARIQDYYV